MRTSQISTILLTILIVSGVIFLSGCTMPRGPPPYNETGGTPNGMPYGGRPGGPEWQPGPGTEGESLEEFRFPPVNTNAPFPEPPAGMPKGEWTNKQLGDVEISYFSTAIIRGMSESGMDFFITLKNNGAAEASVSFSSDSDLVSQVPSWNLHFFSFQDSPVRIAAGAEKKLWYFASVDNIGEFTVTFKLWLTGNENSKVELPVIFGSVEEDFRGKETSVIYGYVKDESGQPVSNARVDAQMNCGRWGFRGDTDDKGRYTIGVFGMEDIAAIYGSRELACDSYDYFVSIAKDGYEYYFKDRVAPTRQNFTRLDITLETRKQSDSVSYAQKWEKKVEDNYGFFWVKASSDFSLFAADQAKHPPELGKPTNFYLFDSQGNVVWKQPTGSECWGIDIAADGSKVVAGCHDNKVYMVSRSGNLLWNYTEGGMVRSACFSRDGAKALSGAIGTIHLFNSADGTKVDVQGLDQWLRNCIFYRDDSGFVAGSRTVVAFDSAANKKWQYVIGEFPLLLSVDENKNVFAAGKSRTLFSWDASGNLRWKHRIPDHVVTAGASTPDGSRIVVGTVGAMVYLFNGEGNVVWKRNTGEVGGQGGTVGHNAVAISLDGSRIVVGTAPGNCIIVYNEKGTIVWNYCAQVEKASQDMLEGVTSVQISNDKSAIAASYGDNYIREFVKV